jgi:hypothetical protein
VDQRDFPGLPLYQLFSVRMCAASPGDAHRLSMGVQVQLFPPIQFHLAFGMALPKKELYAIPRSPCLQIVRTTKSEPA